MFERGIVTENKKRQFHVAVTLEDGRVEHGTCAGAGMSLAETLAAPGQFIELTDSRGNIAFFAKSAIRKIELADMPSADVFTCTDPNHTGIFGIDGYATDGI